MNLQPVVNAILDGYVLPLNGCHGPAHWGRVLENGLRLADSSCANRLVVELFAVFHDSRRINEGSDPGHGLRGANLAAELRGKLFDLGDEDFELLHVACAGHTDELKHPNITIGTCWDADRLDLGRVGVQPSTQFLSTTAAKDPQTIRWADGRAGFGVIPSLVAEEWDIQPASSKNA